MLRKTVRYTDFDGNEAEEVLYFNLSMPELLEMHNSDPDGLEECIKTMIEETFKQLVYGDTVTFKVVKSTSEEPNTEGESNA